MVADSEHRRITVGFLQFLGCDDVIAAEGPAVLHERLTALTDSVTRAAEEHGVTVICIDVGGDGGKFMLACGAPDAQEHDTEMMLRFGLAVLADEPPLPVRLGVNRGNAFAGRVGGPSRWTYSTMGDPVNLAARVMGKAPRGSVMATAAALAHLRSAAELQPVEPFKVKGKSHPVHASIVRGMGPAADRWAAGTTATPFVGRTAELAVLTDAWEAATAGAGQVIELVAEPGAGKSRLLAEAIDRMAAPRLIRVVGERYQRGSAYFAAHLLLRAATDIPYAADPADAGSALTAWTQQNAPELLDWLPLIAVAARAHVPSTPAVDRLAPEFRAPRLRSAVADLLIAALAEPTLLLLEDAYWYDDASVQLLAELLHDATARPWVTCLTRRMEAIGLHGGLGFPVTTLPLTALSGQDAAALARAAAPDLLSADEASRLAAAGNGNPLFVVQMAQAWRPGATEVPPDVETVIAARIDRLDGPARRLLRRAAVLGSFVELDVLHEVLGEPVEASTLTELEEFLVADGPNRVRFAHDLFRTVAYESMPFRRRRELHARAGAVLEQHNERAGRAALLSLHFDAAGDHGRTWTYAVLAAERARASYAHRESAQLLQRALRAARRLPELPGTEVASAAESLGDSCELLGRYDEAWGAYQLSRRHAGDDGASARLLRKIGQVRERQSRYRDALRWYSRAIEAAERLPSGAREAATAAALVGRAAARYRQGRYGEAAAAARAAVEAAQAGHSEADLAHAYFLLDAALTDLHDPAALAVRELALPIYQRIGDLVGEADVHNNVGIDAYYEGRLDDALASYERSLDCRRRAGDLVGAATCENNIGEVLSDLGRFDEARTKFDEALAVWTHADFSVGVALASSNLARVALRQGDAKRARPLLDAAEETFIRIQADALVFETRVRRVELLVIDERYVEAAELAATLRQGAVDAQPSTVVEAALDRAQGIALIRLGDPVTGAAMVRRALTALAAAGMTWDVAQTPELVTLPLA